MRLFRIHLGILLLYCGSLAAHGEGPEMRSVPLLMCSGLPCVEVTVEGGQKLRLLMDTGDFNALLDESVAKNLGLELKPALGIDKNPVPGYNLARLTGLKLGDTRLDDLPVVVANLDTMLKHHAPDANGFLTYPAFKNRIVRLDFVHKTVGFSTPLEQPVPCTGVCGTIQYPSFGKRGPKIVLTNSFSVDGKPVSAQVDTLYTGTLLLYPGAAKTLGYERKADSRNKEFFPYTDGGVEMIKSDAHDISFGKLPLVSHPAVYFATPEVHTPDGMFDGTIGTAVLLETVVTFNFHDDWISIAR